MAGVLWTGLGWREGQVTFPSHRGSPAHLGALRLWLVGNPARSNSERHPHVWGKTTNSRDVPGGPMVKTPHFHCKGHGLGP